ncbi:MAG TPA: NUDIX domain-containing protein [Bacillota bacterium]|nr:NUDIX domain-containing protein [Fastidiosipila sp.]HPX93440.1 NUDIX domain-containing protein [Bacillota bacterium]HQB81212.1 NUDIX domain-containing protein [Bacillota bacterium]
MSGFTKIAKTQIDEALKEMSRQYFVGNLHKNQTIEHLQDTAVEIGLTEYKEFSVEDPHYHDTVTEYHYVVSGWTKYLDIKKNIEYEFKRGDFFVIKRGTIYAQKAKGGTTILFIKVPSINDKHRYKADDIVAEWIRGGLSEIRKDYSYDPASPKANAIRPAAAVAIVENNRILLLKRKDNEKWTMPGGTLEIGENMTACALREVKEETGYTIRITDIIGTYTDPNIKVEYSDGEIRQEFTLLYAGVIVSGHPKLDQESTNFIWIELENADKLPMADSQKTRLKDVRNYFETGERNLR